MISLIFMNMPSFLVNNIYKNVMMQLYDNIPHLVH